MNILDKVKATFGGSKALNNDPMRTGELPHDDAPDDIKVAVFNQLFERSRKRKEARYHGKWARNHELYRNRHWPVSRSKKLPQATINVIFSIVNRTKAILTDNTPVFEFGPGTGSSHDEAFMMDEIRKVWWRSQRMDKKLRMNQHNAELYGAGVIKLPFDPSLENGIGDARSVVCDSFSIFPIGEGEDLQEWMGIIHAFPVALGDIKRMWPDNGDEVEAERDLSSLGADRRDVFGGREQAGHAEVNTPSHIRTRWGMADENTIPQAIVKELWIKDYREVEEEIERDVEVTDNEGNVLLGEDEQPLINIETETIKVAKYPGNIRKITWAGNVILDDVPNPSVLMDPETHEPINPELAEKTFLWNKFPFVKIESNSDTVGEFGFSVIEQVEELVLEIDRKFASIINYLNRQVKPPIIIPKDTGIRVDDVTNLPSMILRPTNAITAQGIRILQVPSLPADYTKSIEFMLFVVDAVTGINDVLEGRKPKGIAAASAIVALQEKGAVIFREKISNMEVGLVDLGQMYVSHVQNFYTEERKMMIIVPKPQEEEQQAQQEQVTQEVGVKGNEFRGKFEINVQAGSTLPMNKIAMRAEAGQLYQLGAIDRRALLNTLQFPNSDEIIARMDENAQLEATVEQQDKTIKALEGQINQIVQKLQQNALGNVIN